MPILKTTQTTYTVMAGGALVGDVLQISHDTKTKQLVITYVPGSGKKSEPIYLKADKIALELADVFDTVDREQRAYEESK